MGDFNAHHKSWNCKKNCSDGNKLFESYRNHDLFLHNLKSITHIQPNSSSQSNIDLIFSTLNLSDKINFQVKDETLGSDHYPIEIKLSVVKNIYRKKSFNLKSVKTNWEKVYSQMDENYQQLLTLEYDQASACNKYLLFFTILTNAITSNTPQKKR